MQTDRLEDQALTRLNQPRNQRSMHQHNDHDNTAAPNGYQPGFLSSLSILGEQALASPSNGLWMESTQPLKVVNTPPPVELSPTSSPIVMPGPSPDDSSLEWFCQVRTKNMPAFQGMPASNGIADTVGELGTYPSGATQGAGVAALRARYFPGAYASREPAGLHHLEASPTHITTINKHSIAATLLAWFYRCWLICATAFLTFFLLWLQSALDRIPYKVSIWRTAVQWAELSWLAPVPLAIILWLGWFIFAEAVRPHPAPVGVPGIAAKRGLLAFAPARPVRLVFRFVTRGDNIDVLRDSVVAVHQAFARYQQAHGPYRIEIISECPISLDLGPDARTHIYVVPPDYVTANRSRYKARALTFLQAQVRPQKEDWYIYLDEESLVDEHMLAGLYRFIQHSLAAEAHAQQRRKTHDPVGLIGQGAILYQGGNWFFRGADALRTADDLGRFRFQYALGLPMFGIHGSFIVVRGIDDARLSFDVGTANSITEDAAWALRAWAQGYRFVWVDGYLHEQPPQRVRDFVRQRSRWLSGIRAVLTDSQIPLRYRVCLGVFTALWQLAFLPFLVAVVALFVHASPFPWMRVPADFAWAAFVLAYLQGIDVQGKHSHPFLKKKRIELQWKRFVSWLLVLCSIWYALLEAAGVLYSLRPKQGFFVIHKPSLAAENKINTTSRSSYEQSMKPPIGERSR